jgi:hypothetical protein
MFLIFKGALCVARTSDPRDVEFFRRMGYTIQPV